MSGSNDLSALQLTVANKLILLNNTYLSNIKNAFLGSPLYVNNNFTNQNEVNIKLPYNYYFNKIFNNYVTQNGVSIADQSADAATSPLDDITTISNKVYVYDASNGGYTEYIANTNTSSTNSFGTLFNIVNNVNNSVTDINCMDLLINIKNRSAPVPELYIFMQGLYGLYNLLDPVLWNMYITGKAVNFNVPDININLNSSSSTSVSSQNIIFTPVTINNGTQSTVLNSKADIKVAMNNILNLATLSTSTNFNPFIARRLIHLYIIMCQYEIALKLYTQQYTSTTYVNDYSNLEQSCFYLLVGLNYNIQKPGGVINDLSSNINTDTNKYNTLSSNIKNLDNVIEKNKGYFNQEHDVFMNKLNTQGKEKIYQYASLAFLIFILIGSALLVSLPLTYANQLLYGSVMTISSILFSIIILKFFATKVNRTPPFNPYSQVNIEKFDNIQANVQAVSSSIYNSHFTTMLNQVINYLDNTLILANIINTRILYDNTLYSMTKEQQHYAEAKDIIINSGMKLQSLTRISYASDIKYNSTMNLILALSVQISITLLLYLLTKSIPILRKFILGASLIIAIIIVSVYILAISSYVHTDPYKYYWAHSKKQ